MKNLIADGVIVLASLLVAGLFGRQFRHVYRVGHENIIRSFVYGGGVGAGFFLLMLLIGAAVPEGRLLFAIFMVVLPVLAVGFSTGSALLAGLAGLDGGRYRFLAILLAGGAVLAADVFFPYISKVITRAALLYGLGASALALQHPLEEEAPAAPESAAAPREQERRRLDGDLTPLPRPGEDE
ncbi:MAG TPA: hypothetical protein DEQ38_00960 [Elusimicrobia bacterium]|nr:MAG: hypothetical protein A2089_09990 [Elusimicrobia bacterium GWD2_63_28]HCC46681.1 hypothetical protein [Elusimicrobiota bacterium]